MEAILVNGQVELVLSESDNYQHEHNPLHYYGRLRKSGIPKAKALEMAKDYEKSYNPHAIKGH